MNVTCPDCRSIFRVDPAKVPTGGVQARCSVCGAVIPVAEARAPAMAAGAMPEVGEHSEMPDTGAVPAAVAMPEPTHTPAPVESNPPPAPATAPAHPTPRVATAVQTPVEPAPSSRVARPVNPYLNNTPELRARRLARALVSDLVAYNPQKREQGLRDGTLRQLFRDEIRKSWDEYVEQVGANVAESTPHFQDALNDVLAGGRRVF